MHCTDTFFSFSADFYYFFFRFSLFTETSQTIKTSKTSAINTVRTHTVQTYSAKRSSHTLDQIGQHSSVRHSSRAGNGTSYARRQSHIHASSSAISERITALVLSSRRRLKQRKPRRSCNRTRRKRSTSAQRRRMAPPVPRCTRHSAHRQRPTSTQRYSHIYRNIKPSEKANTYIYNNRIESATNSGNRYDESATIGPTIHSIAHSRRSVWNWIALSTQSRHGTTPVGSQNTHGPAGNISNHCW
jgi:hypothetical protein